MSVEEPEQESEDTFCAVVPGKHAFTLAGGVYTGNCGACEPECPVEAIFPENEPLEEKSARRAGPPQTNRGGIRMPKSWSNKRERQYEHIKESERKQGR